MAGKTFILYRHKSKAQLRVSAAQIKSAYNRAIATGKWTGQALVRHYLLAHKKRYGFEERLDQAMLAQKANAIAWLAADYKGHAPKIIDTLFESKRLDWVRDRWFVLTSPAKVAEWILPVVEFEATRGKAGEQSEWTLTPESGRPTNATTPPRETSRVDVL